jgi:RNA polymerase sigma-70 factor (ECF subfamily)
MSLSTADATDFGQIEPFRRELTGYCYRMLASPFEAEDAVQETFLRAWRGLSHFEDRMGIRPWLYRIATNVCIDTLKRRSRRALPAEIAPVAAGQFVLGAPRPETTWIAPISDELVASPDPDPGEVTVGRESIRLAFIAALQHLAPRQRAVLILRDVLAWQASEVAQFLETTETGVNSMLRRARSAMAGVELDEIPASPPEIEQELLAGFVDAFQRYDVDALVDLLHEDVLIAMPPFELWLRGVADARTFLASMDDGGHDRVLPIAANGQPAVAVWRPNPSTGALDAYALMVLKVAGDKIISIHAFLDPAIFAAFGLSTTVE